MTPTTFIAIILAFWSSFHLLHTFLLNNSYFGYTVASFLQQSNINISFFNIRWFTSRWNRCFIRMGRMWNSKLKHWFNAGIIFAISAMVIGTILLCHTLYVTVTDIFFKPSHLPSNDQQVLSVIIPGVNLPINDIWYLLSAVFISGILHEIGHAVAAAREGVQINGFGFFAFVIYPGAFVDLHSEDMNRKDPVCQLRIYCAGVWHNFIICLIACGFILILPGMLFPFYTSNKAGVLVTQQSPNSPLHGPMGLQIGDHIIKIDDCYISNTSDWLYCINKTKKSSQWGTCVSLAKIHNLSSHTAFTSEKSLPNSPTTNKNPWIDCCNKDAPQTHLCYQYAQSNRSSMMFACLPGRSMITTQNECFTTEECLDSNEDSRDLVCAKANTEPGVKFIRIVTLQKHVFYEKQNVLFIGDPSDILQSVTVSDLFPRFFLLPLKLPSIIERFLQYMFSMSGALALLNIVPCYALDGQWAFKAILNYCNKGEHITSLQEETISAITLFFGTILLAANIFFGFVHLFTR